jgi:hypothetical protein
MSKSTTTSNETLDALLRGIDPAWRSGATRYIAFHTASPNIGGSQTTNEATYTGYARVAVTAATGFTVASGGSTSNTALIQFPQCTGGSNILTHVSIGTSLTGAGQIIYFGALSSPLTVSNQIQPQFSSGALVASEA